MVEIKLAVMHATCVPIFLNRLKAERNEREYPVFFKLKKSPSVRGFLKSEMKSFFIFSDTHVNVFLRHFVAGGASVTSAVGFAVFAA